MIVHFGSSVGSLKRHPTRFSLICQTIKSLGHTLARDWVTEELNGKTVSPTKKFDFTAKAIGKSDVVVVEMTESSTSVGQQIMMAANKGIPILELRYGKKGSNNNNGLFLPKEILKLSEVAFYTEKNIIKILNTFLEKTANNLGVSRFNLVLERDLDIYLKNKAKKNKTSKTQEIKNFILNDMAKISTPKNLQGN